MASDWIEYAFVLPDGTERYEICAKGSNEFLGFMRYHKAKAAFPVNKRPKQYPEPQQ